MCSQTSITSPWTTGGVSHLSPVIVVPAGHVLVTGASHLSPCMVVPAGQVFSTTGATHLSPCIVVPAGQVGVGSVVGATVSSSFGLPHQPLLSSSKSSSLPQPLLPSWSARSSPPAPFGLSGRRRRSSDRGRRRRVGLGVALVARSRRSRRSGPCRTGGRCRPRRDVVGGAAVVGVVVLGVGRVRVVVGIAVFIAPGIRGFGSTRWWLSGPPCGRPCDARMPAPRPGSDTGPTAVRIRQR